MALNRYIPHLYVLPEDDATRSIANGFSDKASGPMQILNPAGGWPHVLQKFQSTHVGELQRFKDMHMVLLIDFDNDFANRLAHFKSHIPSSIADRVYVLGALGEAEDLKPLAGRKLGRLGQNLADECANNASAIWNDAQLIHNQAELARLHQNVKPFLL